MHRVHYPSVLDVLVLVFFRAISRRLPGGCLASTRYLVGCLSRGPVLNGFLGRFLGVSVFRVLVFLAQVAGVFLLFLRWASPILQDVSWWKSMAPPTMDIREHTMK